MFNWIPGLNLSPPNDVDRIIASNTVEEADILYAGLKSRKTRNNVVPELDDRGLDVTDLKPSDIYEEDGEIKVKGIDASKLEGKTVFYRQASFLSDVDDELEKERLLFQLKDEYDVNFFNSVDSAYECKNKRQTKRSLQQAFHSLDNVRVADTYGSYQEADRLLDEDELLVEKPEYGSCGDGVEFVEFGELEEEDFEDPDKMYEEVIDHSKENVKEVRAIDMGPGSEKEFVQRKSGSGDLEVKNIDKNGHYEDHEPSEKEKQAIRAASRELGMDESRMDFGAMDYLLIDEDDSVEVVVLEYNSTPGTRYADFHDKKSEGEEGFYEKLVDSIEYSHSLHQLETFSDRIFASIERPFMFSGMAEETNYINQSPEHIIVS